MKKFISILLTAAFIVSALPVTAMKGERQSSVKYRKFYPTDDTYVANNAGTKGTVYGKEDHLYAISRPYDNEARKIYMKFDCSGLTDSISTAKLHIKSNPRKVNDIVQSEVNVNFSAISDKSWSEDNTCWSNRPQEEITENLGSIFYEQVSDTWYSIDITNYIKNSNDKILSLLLTTDEIGAGRCYFYSKDGDGENAPYIEITSGLNIVKDINYNFTDSAGNKLERPETGGSVTASTTVMSPMSAINKGYMFLTVYDKRIGKLIDAKNTVTAIQRGVNSELSCTLDNLPEYSRSIQIKCYFMTDLQSPDIYVNTSAYKDPAFPVYSEGQIYVESPEYRSDINTDTVKVRLYAPKFESVKVECAHPPDETSKTEYNKVIAGGIVPQADGYVEFDFPASEYSYGPVAITITAMKNNRPKKKYLQLYNKAGVKWNMGAPETPVHAQGMKLVYEDDFDGELSIARNDSSAKYGSHTPYWGDYGDARFEDFEREYNPFKQQDSFLKIEARGPEGYEKVDPNGRKYYGGLLSTVHPDGNGPAWKMGYFECRMMMPPGIGVWPSFWLLSKNRMDPNRKSTCELDVVEGYLYQDDIAKICISRWSFSEDVPKFGDHYNFNLTEANMMNLVQTFHVYACKVTEENIYFYIDDQLAWTYPTYEEAKGELFFLINLALGKGGGPSTDLSEYNEGADLYVDYVRVYVPE